MQPQGPYPQVHPNEYEFITNPSAPQRAGGMGRPNSMIMRIVVVAGGLTVLIILFVILKGVLSGGSAAPLYFSLLQDQDEIVHLATNAGQEKSLSQENMNFSLNAQLSMTSAERQFATYLKANGQKINAKQVALKESPLIDKQLTDASAASNYNAVYTEIMKTKLTNYQTSLTQTYKKTKGSKGKALLSQQFEASKLLLQQLGVTEN
jgi:hypothetical protein